MLKQPTDFDGLLQFLLDTMDSNPFRPDEASPYVVCNQLNTPTCEDVTLFKHADDTRGVARNGRSSHPLQHRAVSFTYDNRIPCTKQDMPPPMRYDRKSLGSQKTRSMMEENRRKEYNFRVGLSLHAERMHAMSANR